MKEDKKVYKQMEELSKNLEKYNYYYYTLNENLISDYEYDQMLQKLEDLEKKYPHYADENSLTKRVGDIKIKKFEKSSHNTPMLSLANAFSYEDLVEFDMRVQKEIRGDYNYICELKIDGIAISINYQNKKFKKALTRGDGKIGEDVSHNVATIKTLPKKIKDDIEVRGEIFISKKNFLKIQEDEEQVYANPRNLAAGTVRQLDNKVAQSRNLSIFVYGLSNYKNLEHQTYYQSMQYLKENGFKINEKLKRCATIDQVYDYINEITKQRENLGYEIDGVVIKVDEYKNQQILGNTSKYPKWAIAYKFKSDFATTRLLDIIYTVGRTGKVVPNAVLEPVFLMGSLISRATLHNEDYIISKNIKIGDEIKIIKAGDIIPRVEEVIFSTNPDFVFSYPKNCPACDEKIYKVDKDYICSNPSCSGKNIEKIIYFISPSGFDIKGVGIKLIQKLYNSGLITDYIDLFDLNYEKMYKLEGYKEKSISNVLAAIESSKSIELANFISALGVKNLGLETSKEIAKKYETLDEILNLLQEDFLGIEGIGDKIAQEAYDFFTNKNNIEKIEYLKLKGVMINNTYFEKTKDIEDSYLKNKKIVITGKFEKITRTNIKKIVEKKGGKIISAISKNTDILFCGSDAGSKLNKAKDLDVKIVYEKDLDKFLE